jgi:hypothetical protein
MLLAASLTLLVLAAALLALGVRGRVVDDHPICRKCRFDLIGLVSPANCPECGSPLHNPAAIRHGARRHRPAAIVLGSLMLLTSLGLFGATTWSRATHYNWNKAKPTWWLVHDAEHDTTPDDEVLTELLARRSANTLDSSVYPRLVAHALVRQADLTMGWSVLWGDLVDDALSRGEMTSAQYQQFLGGAVVTSLRFRSRIASGTNLPYSVSANFSRGSRALLSYSIDERDFSIEGDDGRELTFSPRGGLGMSGLSAIPATDSLRIMSSSIYLMDKVPPGKRRTTLRLSATTTLHNSNALAPSSTVDIVHSAAVEYLPPGQSPVRMVSTPELAQAIQASIRNFDVEHSPGWDGGYLSLNLTFNDLPVNVSFKVKALGIGADGKEHEWDFPSVVAKKGSGGYGPGGRAPKGFDAPTVTIILTGDPGPAEQTMEMDEAWAGEIVLKDIPVHRHAPPVD